jgi:hypothetical protein
MKHFKLTEEKKDFNGVILTRIELTKDCKWGKVGDKGGWIEKKENLSGNAWVSGDAWWLSPLQIQGSVHYLTECKKGFLKIGRIELSINDWKLKFNEIGKQNSYSDSQIEEYGYYIELADKLNKLRK